MRKMDDRQRPADTEQFRRSQPPGIIRWSTRTLMVVGHGNDCNAAGAMPLEAAQDSVGKVYNYLLFGQSASAARRS